jgi:hypothetical protein
MLFPGLYDIGILTRVQTRYLIDGLVSQVRQALIGWEVSDFL